MSTTITWTALTADATATPTIDEPRAPRRYYRRPECLECGEPLVRGGCAVHGSDEAVRAERDAVDAYLAHERARSRAN